jgi:hypothetical protein
LEAREDGGEEPDREHGAPCNLAHGGRSGRSLSTG